VRFFHRAAQWGLGAKKARALRDAILSFAPAKSPLLLD